MKTMGAKWAGSESKDLKEMTMPAMCASEGRASGGGNSKGKSRENCQCE